MLRSSRSFQSIAKANPHSHTLRAGTRLQTGDFTVRLAQHANQRLTSQTSRFSSASARIARNEQAIPAWAFDDLLKQMRSQIDTKQEQASALHRQLNIAFFTNSHNSMSQQLFAQLRQDGHTISVHSVRDEAHMVELAEAISPDLIICPFLTKRIPDQLWQNNRKVPCLIVHPGIEGDRGASSIDWALEEGREEWGVTVLEADAEMDAGAIWSTNNFKLPPMATKSGVYQKLCTMAAMEGVRDAVSRFAKGLRPRPLDYNNPAVKGSLMPNMKAADRNVNFEKMSADVAERRVRMSDGRPGASCETLVDAKGKVFLHGAVVEGELSASAIIELAGDKPAGSVIAQRNGAVLVLCGDRRSAVWIQQLRRPGKNSLKMPAMDVLNMDQAPPVVESPLGLVRSVSEGRPQTFQEAWVSVDKASRTATVEWDVYNGAMSTSQCQRLEQAVKAAGALADIDMVVIAGGSTCFSNGINLNTIELSADPAQESWDNINAINDVVKAIFNITDKATVSVFRGNAGAGGVMMALAADYVFTYPGVVLNPHYKGMNLFGSEYWSFFLPRRVGQEEAHRLTESMLPVSAEEAVKMGLVDGIITPPSLAVGDAVHAEVDVVSQSGGGREMQWGFHRHPEGPSHGSATTSTVHHYHSSPSQAPTEPASRIKTQLQAVADMMAQDNTLGFQPMTFSPIQRIDRARTIAAKKMEWTPELFAKAEKQRSFELGIMMENFADAGYHIARRNFVYKNATMASAQPHYIGMSKHVQPAQMLDGVAVANEWKAEIGARVEALKKKHNGKTPCLAIVLPNNRPDSQLYVKTKVKACNQLGIEARVIVVDPEASVAGTEFSSTEEQMMAQIEALNADPAVTGIIVQKPLPQGWNTARADEAISPMKDVDCVHPSYMGRLLLGQFDNPNANSGFGRAPCTPRGVMQLLNRYSIGTMGQKAVVIGRSMIVGTPLASMLTRRLATVTLCDRHTRNLDKIVGEADLVFVCAGVPGLVRGEWLKQGAVVVDVGINDVTPKSEVRQKRKIVGDVHFESAAEVASYITPVPGGVGPMTVAAVLGNTVDLFEEQISAGLI